MDTQIEVASSDLPILTVEGLVTKRVLKGSQSTRNLLPTHKSSKKEYWAKPTVLSLSQPSAHESPHPGQTELIDEMEIVATQAGNTYHTVLVDFPGWAGKMEQQVQTNEDLFKNVYPYQKIQ